MVRRIIAIALLLSMALSGLTVAWPPATASATGTALFNESFLNSTLNDPASVVRPPGPGGSTNVACLTASTATGASPLPGCTGTADANGAGALRLTSNVFATEGGLFARSSIPTANGLDIAFNTYQYATTTASPADGLGFAISAVDPSNPAPPANIGGNGGALGYAPKPASSQVGLSNGYLGFGLDVFGNYSNNFWNGTGCSTPAYIGNLASVPRQVLVRGPGNNLAGYCPLNSTATTTSSPAVALTGGQFGTRSTSVVPVEVVINPGSSHTTQSGLVVAADTYQIAFTPIGGSRRVLSGPLPSASGFTNPSWLDASGIPKQLAFGWVGSTGGSNEKHEISGVQIGSLVPAPALTLTHYFIGSLSPGTANTLILTAGVATGVDENKTVTVTDTLAAGLTPTAALGTGWSCGVSGQTVTCTSNTSAFPAGTALSPIAITTTVGSAVTVGTLTNTIARVSSDDAVPVYTPATISPPPAPTALTSSGNGTQTATASIPTGGAAHLLDIGNPTGNITVAGQGTYGIDATTGVITFTPVPGFSGAATPVNFRVTDNFNQSGDSTYTPTVLRPTKGGTTDVTPTGNGYWAIGSNGSVNAFGDAGNTGSMAGRALNAPMVGISITPSANGYYLAGADGGVFTFGDAAFQGSMGGLHLNAPVVSVATKPTGDGYWLAAKDGGVFAFGDARYSGNMVGTRLNKPVVGLSPTQSGDGYWIVAGDGGVFVFGDAQFYGSSADLHLNQPVVGLARTPSGNGYWLAAADGGVFAFGDAQFYGSTGSNPPNQKVVGIIGTITGHGYSLVKSDHSVINFGDASL